MTVKLIKMDKKRKSTKLDSPTKNPKKQKTQVDEDELSALKLDLCHINKDVFHILTNLMDSSNLKKQELLNTLIKFLNDESDDEKRTATCAYALRRLVRCTGSDDRYAVALSASYVNALVRQVEGIDPIQILDILKRVLPVNGENKGKDDSLAVVGHLLTALSLLTSQHLAANTTKLIDAIYPILVAHLKGREYLVAMCSRILKESFSQVKPDIFESHAWPLLQVKLSKPITKQTLRTCDLLLAVHLNFASTVSLSELKSILWPNQQPQYAQLFDLYFDSNNNISSEDVNEHLGNFLASSPDDEQLLMAWQQHIATKMPLKRIAAKCYILVTLSQILLYYDDSKHSDNQLERLFNSKFFTMLLQELWVMNRQAKIKKLLKSSSHELRDCFYEFEMDLLTSFKTLLTQQTKLKIIMSLIKKKPDLDDAMQTPNLTHKLFQELDEHGQSVVYNFYQKLLTSQDENLGKWQRQYYLNQMYHLQLLLKRSNDLNFLLSAAIFHLDAEQQPCVIEQTSLFSRQTASRCEELLFSCLSHNVLSNAEQLAAFNELLRGALKPLCKQITKPEYETKLRTKLTPESKLVWEQVRLVIEACTEQIVPNEPVKRNTMLALVFDSLTLSLGLALLMHSYSISPELITDVLICKENALNSKKKPDISMSESNPSWQEVLTDVLLQLQLQTSSFWREFVKSIFELLMPHLGRVNLGQMLDTLDMTKNPLAKHGERDTDNDDEDEENEENEKDMDVDENVNDEQDSNNDSDEDEIESDGDDKDNDETTVLAQIRENVRLALLADDNDDDNASSVDWNDVSEEQGEHLNQALETAFQTFKPKGQGKSKSKRQTKSERINTTALMHFRIRVLDMVEKFVITGNADMEMRLETMNRVFLAYFYNCNDNKLQPLSQRCAKLLRKLISTNLGTPSLADKMPIVDSIEEFMELKTPGPQVFQLRNACIIYLFTNIMKEDLGTGAVDTLLQKYLCNTPAKTIDDFFKGQWNGIPDVAIRISKMLSAAGNWNKQRRSDMLVMLLKRISHIKRIMESVDGKDSLNELKTALSEYQPGSKNDRQKIKKLLARLQ